MNTEIGITLIGAGRVGMNILRHLHRKELSVLAVVEPDLSKHAAIRSFLSHTKVLAALPPTLPHETDICILCTPDEHIASVAEALAQTQALHSAAMVFHVSGLKGSEELITLDEIGCTAGSVHPIQSFTDAPLDPTELEDIGCGIEGSDRFWREASSFAELLNWQPIRISAQRKAEYHTACVIAGNFITVLASQAELLLRSAAESDEPVNDLLLPMMETVLNRLRDIPPERVLTGPAVRGDTHAVSMHLEVVKENPELLATYRTLTRAALRMSPLSQREKSAIATLLDTTE